MTQIANDYKLGRVGVRVVRFNIQRGRIDNIDDIVALANALSSFMSMPLILAPHIDPLSKPPQIVIEHLGMTVEGVPVLLDLVAAGRRDGHPITSSVRARKRCRNPPRHHVIADYAAETT